MAIIDKSFSGKKIVAHKGDVIQIDLAENATTGYVWKIKSIDDKQLQVKKNENTLAGSGIGGGGMHTFYIDVISEGTSELHIALGNPWENDTEETFSITIES
ncbi:putative secreted protein [Flavobacterium sp. PL11]|jgi:predicted secreted protein|uniref:protease inhibitor I42 family protein n=1 Tax=Flavobacterium sp. PL11 TaxID=3071717 RepID=UPI002E0274A5|nr:putative secreted protein [Flavobacterium sp. PL11]